MWVQQQIWVHYIVLLFPFHNGMCFLNHFLRFFFQVDCVKINLFLYCLFQCTNILNVVLYHNHRFARKLLRSLFVEVENRPLCLWKNENQNGHSIKNIVNISKFERNYRFLLQSTHTAALKNCAQSYILWVAFNFAIQNLNAVKILGLSMS